ncbi:MAG: hypothetical protein IPP37_07555 [Saprospiraceae bacterium]|nr:hypothetical protein [Saprospiraceae bacterium]
MANKLAVLFMLIIIYSSCSTLPKDPELAHFVGDIYFDPEQDDPQFMLCDDQEEVFQYFNFSRGMQIKGEKKALDRYIKTQFKNTKASDNGYVRVRFIVNCKGETGRFRLLVSDLQFKEAALSKELTSQLMQITKGIKGWQIIYHEGKNRDYYQYLTFKIVNGDIKEILP